MNSKVTFAIQQEFYNKIEILDITIASFSKYFLISTYWKQTTTDMMTAVHSCHLPGTCFYKVFYKKIELYSKKMKKEP
jgi:hypothetical protein